MKIEDIVSIAPALALLFSLGTLLTGICTVVVTVLVYKHNKNQSRDAWLHMIKEIHADFWKDEDMEKVRAWLANDDAYSTVQPIFKLRCDMFESKSKPEQPLSSEDYETIDKLDKFLHLMFRVIKINPQMEAQENILYPLFSYWIERTLSPERDEIRKYSQEFYGKKTGAIDLQKFIDKSINYWQ